MDKLLTLQATIFLLTAVGYMCKRLGIVGDQGQKNLIDLVIYVVLPCNILKAFLVNETEGMLFSLRNIFLISFGIQFFCIAYAKLVYRRQSPGTRKCLYYATICSNAGFLGNPIAEGVYGAEGLLLASVYLIPLRIMMWSSGIAVFSGTRDLKKTIRLLLTHPCILACVAGIAFMLAGWKLPAGIMGAVTTIGNCTTALSMMCIGMTIAKIRFRELWDWTALGYCLHRLLLIPLAVYLVCLLLPVSPTVAGVSVLLAAMPAGTTTSILAEKYQVEPVFATKLVVLSTLLSLPSMALWCFVLQR